MTQRKYKHEKQHNISKHISRLFAGIDTIIITIISHHCSRKTDIRNYLSNYNVNGANPREQFF